jgi:hypothetical protein
VSYRKECTQLKEELEARSVRSLFSDETLFKTQCALRSKEVELIKAKVQIMELQGLLKEKGRTGQHHYHCKLLSFIKRKHRKLVSYFSMSLLLLLHWC